MTSPTVENVHIKIFDTTLRDGQQCPGAGMSFDQNLTYAQLAHKLRVDVLEAGFPFASQRDFEIVNAIAQEYSSHDASPTVAALCQLRAPQIETTIDALSPTIPCKRGRLHVYVPVSPDLMKASLGELANDPAKIIQQTEKLIRLASEAGLEVEFSAEAYSQMAENFDFVTDLFRAAVEAGATIINCPDTVGVAALEQGEDYFVAKMRLHAAILRKEYPGKAIVWSAHCHDDLGNALQNTKEAFYRGPCSQVEGCINGVGERAGNLALEQVIMNIRKFGATAVPGKHFITTVDTSMLGEIGDFVSEFMLPTQPHSPITGSNAYRHSSGGHTNAIRSNPLVYQAFDPAVVGRKITLVFGPLSGGNHSQEIIETAGYVCDSSEKAAIAHYIKECFQDRRKGITDSEVMIGYKKYREPISIDTFNYERSGGRATMHLIGKFFDLAEVHETTSGKDSALATLEFAIKKQFSEFTIERHSSESIGSGIHARNRATITVKSPAGLLFSGVGEDNDIEISAMRALIDGVNQAYIEHYFRTSSDSGTVESDMATPSNNNQAEL